MLVVVCLVLVGLGLGVTLVGRLGLLVGVRGDRGRRGLHGLRGLAAATTATTATAGVLLGLGLGRFLLLGRVRRHGLRRGGGGGSGGLRGGLEHRCLEHRHGRAHGPAAAARRGGLGLHLRLRPCPGLHHVALRLADLDDDRVRGNAERLSDGRDRGGTGLLHGVAVAADLVGLLDLDGPPGTVRDGLGGVRALLRGGGRGGLGTGLCLRLLTRRERAGLQTA